MKMGEERRSAVTTAKKHAIMLRVGRCARCTNILLAADVVAVCGLPIPIAEQRNVAVPSALEAHFFTEDA